MKKLVYLSLGSNMGDRKANLQVAIDHLRALGDVKSASSFYETEPVEVSGQPWFVNCAVGLETELMPRQFLTAILGIERKMGRQRSKAKLKAPRTIDIDILLFGNSIVEAASLAIPHPAMHERRFVLVPLAEIAPEVRHPALKKTVLELRNALPPGQAVRPL